MDVQRTSREGTAFSMASFHRDDGRRMDTRVARRDARLLVGDGHRSREEKTRYAIDRGPVRDPRRGVYDRHPLMRSMWIHVCPPIFFSLNGMQRRRLGKVGLGQWLLSLSPSVGFERRERTQGGSGLMPGLNPNQKNQPIGGFRGRYRQEESMTTPTKRVTWLSLFPVGIGRACNTS